MLLGASSFILCFFMAAFTEIVWLGGAMVCVWLLVAAGLVFAPVFAAFRRYLPLYVLMGIDVIGRALAIVNNILADNDYRMHWLVTGLILSVVTLVLTVRMLRRPEPGEVCPEIKKPRWYKRREALRVSAGKC